MLMPRFECLDCNNCNDHRLTHRPNALFLFRLQVFKRIREEKPEVYKKLVPIPGDVTSDKLGISPEHEQLLIDTAEIVFHCAATLKLEARLKDAIEMNTIGTKRILDLCLQMKRLKALLHLSTAFCYCDKVRSARSVRNRSPVLLIQFVPFPSPNAQEVLTEKVHDFHHNPYDLMRTVEWMDEKALDMITPNLLTPHPNTYTYSKRLAEMLVRDTYSKLRVCIVRPSIGKSAMSSERLQDRSSRNKRISVFSLPLAFQCALPMRNQSKDGWTV